MGLRVKGTDWFIRALGLLSDFLKSSKTLTFVPFYSPFSLQVRGEG